MWELKGLREKMIRHIDQGYDVSLFAYGATGSGKSHTIRGGDVDWGVLPRICQDVYGVGDAIYVSHVEVHNDKVYDLLAPPNSDPLKVSVIGSVVILNGVQKVRAMNSAQLNAIIMNSAARLTFSRTQCNPRASRSHSIVTLYIAKSYLTPNGNTKVRMSKVNVIDLAGNEHTRDSKVQGVQFKETCRINASLTALGRVITALSNDSVPHVPFRDNVLTMLLSGSLSGNGKTFLVATICPTNQYFHDTLRTLGFARNCEGVVQVLEVAKDIQTQMSEFDSLVGSGDEEAKSEMQQWFAAVKKEVGGVVPSSRPQPSCDDQQQVQQQQRLLLQRYHTGNVRYESVLQVPSQFNVHKAFTLKVKGTEESPQLWVCLCCLGDESSSGEEDGGFCVYVNGCPVMSSTVLVECGDRICVAHVTDPYVIVVTMRGEETSPTVFTDAVAECVHVNDSRRLKQSQNIMMLMDAARLTTMSSCPETLECNASPENCWLTEYSDLLTNTLRARTPQSTTTPFWSKEFPRTWTLDSLTNDVVYHRIHSNNFATTFRDLLFFMHKIEHLVAGGISTVVMWRCSSTVQQQQRLLPQQHYFPKIVYHVEGTRDVFLDPVEALQCHAGEFVRFVIAIAQSESTDGGEGKGITPYCGLTFTVKGVKPAGLKTNNKQSSTTPLRVHRSLTNRMVEAACTPIKHLWQNNQQRKNNQSYEETEPLFSHDDHDGCNKENHLRSTSSEAEVQHYVVLKDFGAQVCLPCVQDVQPQQELLSRQHRFNDPNTLNNNNTLTVEAAKTPGCCIVS
eukprot:PhF_6_TR40453/c0_g1_i1/m.60431